MVSVSDEMRQKATGVARHRRGVFADGQARWLVTDHPAAQHRVGTSKLRQRGIGLPDGGLALVRAGGFGGIVAAIEDGDVLSLARRQRFAHARFGQIAVYGVLHR